MALSEGWSVLVTGPARRVDDPDEVGRWSCSASSRGLRARLDTLVRIEPDEVTGRVIVTRGVVGLKAGRPQGEAMCERSRPWSSGDGR